MHSTKTYTSTQKLFIRNRHTLDNTSIFDAVHLEKEVELCQWFEQHTLCLEGLTNESVIICL